MDSCKKQPLALEARQLDGGKNHLWRAAWRQSRTAECRNMGCAVVADKIMKTRLWFSRVQPQRRWRRCQQAVWAIQAVAAHRGDLAAVINDHQLRAPCPNAHNGHAFGIDQRRSHCSHGRQSKPHYNEFGAPAKNGPDGHSPRLWSKKSVLRADLGVNNYSYGYRCARAAKTTHPWPQREPDSHQHPE